MATSRSPIAITFHFRTFHIFCFLKTTNCFFITQPKTHFDFLARTVNDSEIWISKVKFKPYFQKFKSWFSSSSRRIWKKLILKLSKGFCRLLRWFSVGEKVKTSIKVNNWCLLTYMDWKDESSMLVCTHMKNTVNEKKEIRKRN